MITITLAARRNLSGGVADAMYLSLSRVYDDVLCVIVMHVRRGHNVASSLGKRPCAPSDFEVIMT